MQTVIDDGKSWSFECEEGKRIGKVFRIVTKECNTDEIHYNPFGDKVHPSKLNIYPSRSIVMENYENKNRHMMITLKSEMNTYGIDVYPIKMRDLKISMSGGVYPLNKFFAVTGGSCLKGSGESAISDIVILQGESCTLDLYYLRAGEKFAFDFTYHNGERVDNSLTNWSLICVESARVRNGKVYKTIQSPVACPINDLNASVH